MKYLAFIVALVTSCAAAEISAAPVLSFLDGSGDPTSVSVSPGGSFSFNVSLNSDTVSFSGLTYFLHSSIAQKITVTQRVTAPTNPIPDPTTSNSGLGLPHILDATANPIPVPDLGYSSGGQNIAAGAYAIDTLTFSVDATTPLGAYTISAASGSGLGVTSGSSATFTAFSTAATYNVNVVPEPAAVVLFVSGVTLTACYAARRSRHRVKCTE